MNSNTENQYEQDRMIDWDDDLNVSENIIASRQCSFDDMDGEYLDALREISMRVQCPLCHRKKRQLCVNTMNGEPAHKSRMRLLNIESKKVYDNVHYAINSSKLWKGDRIVVRVNGTWEIVDCTNPQWRELWLKQLESI